METLSPELTRLIAPGKAPAQTRVVVAMSGGVDSAVTAALLAKQGYEVVGVTLQLYDHGAATARRGACCAGQDIHDAARVAERVGIPHYVLDYEDAFRGAVVEEFADAYLRGETPIPCVRCNQTVKFRDLLSVARELGADALATGHYIRREDGPEGPELHRAVDESRDQSYFLFATTRAQLGFLRFPLGGLPKSETRRLARRFALPVAAKPDSQDICFAPNGDYADIVRKLRPGAADPGEIVHLDGAVLGRHDGIVGYTIGQRKGLGVGGRRSPDGRSDVEPLFVVRLDAENSRVIVGPRAALGRSQIELTGLNWLGAGENPPQTAELTVKLRNTMAPVPATLCGSTVRLERPADGISPGQACVFYDGARVLGGGWITVTR